MTQAPVTPVVLYLTILLLNALFSTLKPFGFYRCSSSMFFFALFL